MRLILKDSVRTPIVYGIAATVLAAVISYADQYQIEGWVPSVFLTRVDLGRNILTAIATSLLTMSTITFSVMTMAMNTYATQYSPRTLPNFYSDPVTVRAKSLFLGGFLYAILTLLLMKDKLQEQYVLAPAIAVIIAVFIVGYFMYFIQYVSRMTQVNHLLTRLSRDAIRIAGRHAAAHAERLSSPPQPDGPILGAPSTGYVQHADTAALIRIAKEHNCSLEVLPGIGDFVTKHTPFIRIRGMQDKQEQELESQILDAVPIGDGRSNTDDMEYMVQKISEIALRAISPSTNDPNTAIYSIRELGRVLTAYGRGLHGPLAFRDDSGMVRIVLHFIPFERLLYKTFYQIIHYASQDLSVMSEIVDTLRHLYHSGDEEMRQATVDFARHVVASMDEGELIGYDRTYWYERIHAFEAATGHRIGQAQ